MKELKATDLRVGNYVEYKSDAVKMLTISEIYINIKRIGGTHRVQTIATDYLNIKPIELTEEWFIKFGFVKSNRIDFGELSPCYLIGSFSVVIRRNSFYVDWIGGNTEIKYVHQLQNLYFALTGQELKVKF